MKRLGAELSKLAYQLKEMKSVVAEMNKDKPKEKPVLLDFRHINANNLELEDLVIKDAPFFQCKPLPFCGRCKEGFRYRSNEQNTQVASVCKFCEIPRRRMNKLSKLQLPSDSYGMHFNAYEWDSPTQQARVNHLLAWMKNPNERQINASPSIYLRGEPGNGKTSLLYCLAKDAIFAGQRVMYISHNQLVDQIKRSFNGEKDPLKHWLDKTDLLLFDEFCGVGGGANQTNWFKSTTADIVQKIYERWKSGQLSVVITSNLTNQQLKTSIDHNKAILSRFIAMFGEPVTMIGRDRRVSNNQLLNAWIG
jgi:DNA replication protein DnaC